MDVLAVGFYLSGVVFLLPIALMELGLIFRNKPADEKRLIIIIIISVKMALATILSFIDFISKVLVL